MSSTQRKFGGVAYWSLATVDPDWADLAIEAVQPLCDAKKATVKTSRYPNGSVELVLDMPEGSLSMLTKSNSGKGIVRDDYAARTIVLCLMAIRKKLPMLSLVDDSQVAIPFKVTQHYPLFADSWETTSELGSILGLFPSKRFLETEGAVTQLMF